MRLHVIPHSTNVERVALAPGLRGLHAARVVHHRRDASPRRRRRGPVHTALVAHLGLEGGFPRIAAWLGRMRELPRA